MSLIINGKTYRVTRKTLDKYNSIDELIEKHLKVKVKTVGGL